MVDSPPGLHEWKDRFAVAAATLDVAALRDLEASLPRAGDAGAHRLRFLAVWSSWWTEGPLVAAHRARGLQADGAAWTVHERQALAYLQALGDLHVRRRDLSAAARTASHASGPGQIAIRVHGALPVLVARFHGVEGRFVLDTGAPGNLVTTAYAQRAGLEPAPGGRTVYDGGGSSIKLRPAIASEVAFAGAPPVVDAVIDVADLGPRFPFDGLISPQALWRGLDLCLDGPALQLRIGPIAARSVHEAPLRWVEGQPYVLASAGGRTLHMLLDTGAGGNLLMDDAARSLQLAVDPGAGTVRSATAAGFATIQAGGSLRVRIGTAPEEALHYAVKRRGPPAPACFASPLQGYLGWPWIAQRETLLPADRRILHFSAPAGRST